MKCEPCLPRSTGPGQREEADVRAREHPAYVGELVLAAEELRRRDREVRPVERLQRRELVGAKLVNPLWRAQVLEPVLTEVAELLPLDERGRCSRDQHLPPMARRREPRGAVNIRSDIALLRQQRRAGVEAHPYRQRDLLLRLTRRSECTGGGREGDEKRISLRINLNAALPLERLPQDSPMFGQPRCVLRLPDLVQEPRRTLNVRE
jgi:hypothetical protein